MMFEIYKDMEYYNQCVNLCRESILIYPDNNPEQFSPFINLGGVFFEFYKENGEVSVLCEGLDYYRDALKLCPPDHPLRYNVLGGHSRSLQYKFEVFGEITDLEESITLSREALRLVPLDHPDRSELLNDLANALHRRYCHLGDVENLDESMDFHREALTLCPPSHPSR